MPRRHEAIRVSRRFRAPPAQVFAAWLEPSLASRWLFATGSRPLAQVEIDARVAGAFRFVDRRHREAFEYRGKYVEIAPHRRLVFTFSMAARTPAITRVAVEIEALRRGCALTLSHQDVPRSEEEYLEARWIGSLYGLGVTLDGTATTFHDDQE